MSGPQVDYAEYAEGRLAWLRRLAYLLCQDWHEADDLVQATLTRLYTYWPRVARMDNIDAYVRTILVRTFLGERRSPWFRRVLLPGSAQADGVAAGADPDAVLDVRQALAAIPPRQRATLVLRFYRDLDVEQAAAVLGCSAGTVKSQTSKGLAALRRMLEPAWGHDRLGRAPPMAGGADGDPRDQVAHDEQVHMWECVLLTSGAAPLTAACPLRWVASLGGYRLAGSHLPAQDPSETGR